jgi:hypothetical protein
LAEVTALKRRLKEVEGHSTRLAGEKREDELREKGGVS